MKWKNCFVNIKTSWTYFKDAKVKFFTYIFLLCVKLMSQISVPILFEKIISNLLEDNRQQIFRYIAYVCFAYILVEVIMYAEQKMYLSYTKLVNFNVKRECIKYILETDFYFNEEENHGRLYNVFLTDTVCIVSYVSNFLKIVINIVAAISTFCIVFIINSKLAFLICITYPLEYYITNLYNKKLQGIVKEVYSKTDEISSFFKNVINNLRDIKNQIGEGKIEEKVIRLSDEGRKLAIQQGEQKIMQTTIVSAIRLVNYMLFLLLGMLHFMKIKLLSMGNEVSMIMCLAKNVYIGMCVVADAF